MTISWLSALKVVPWDKVLEHAPGVLEKARGFIDKHRNGGLDAPSELVQLAQQQMAQALAELAEQNAALIVAVRRLQVRLWWLSIGLVLAICACGAVVFGGSSIFQQKPCPQTGAKDAKNGNMNRFNRYWDMRNSQFTELVRKRPS